MAPDSDEILTRAEDYLLGEGIEEVHSTEIVDTKSSAFGVDTIIHAEIEDDQESECWVIGGSSPMNVYPKSKFETSTEAFQFHVGTISLLMQDGIDADEFPEWVGYDAFICHASEDKDEFVRPLAEKLEEKQFRVWYDEFEIAVGDSLRQSIDEGLRESAFAIVVLSEAFFEKEWTQYELNGLVARETSGEKVILPVWYNIGKEEIAQYSPSLVDKRGVKATEDNVDEVAETLYDTIINEAEKELAKEKVEAMSNDES